MGVYIEGMEMPKSCGKCLFRDGIFCMAVNGKRISYSGLEIKEYFCPLVEVPPHGRLIDADKLIRDFQATADDEWNKNCNTTWSAGFLEAINMTEDAPTVIEAKDGE